MRIPVPSRCLAAISSLLALTTGHADTIFLKDGTSLEGRVVREEGDNYVLEVQVTKSIRDERRLPKTSVAKIQRETDDEKPYQALKELVPVPDLATTADYDKLLEEKFDPFLKQHGTSRHYREVRDMRKAIIEERNVIAGGGIKLNGRLIQAAERKADAVDIDASASFAGMSAAADKGDFLTALRIFSQIERDFAGTKAHAEATVLAKQVLTVFRARLNSELAALPERLRQRETGLERMDPEQRARAKEMFALQQKAAETRAAKERQEQLKWLSVNPDRKESIEETLRLIDAERTRLQTPAATAGTESPGAAYREAWQKLGSAKPEEATTILENFKTFQLPGKYLAMLEERAAPGAPNPQTQP